MEIVYGSEQPRKGPQLEVEVRDFGPISSGAIRLTPLTIFIGPNNSGKSYAAMLIHSIFESQGSGHSRYLYRRRFFFRSFRDIDAFLKKNPDLTKKIQDLIETGEFELPKAISETIIRYFIEDLYEHRLSDELIRAFASPLRELINIGRNKLQIKIHDRFGKTLISIDKHTTRVQTTVDFIPPSAKFTIRQSEQRPTGLTINRREGREHFAIRGKTRPEEIVSLVLEQFQENLLPQMNARSFYLPAARSGILQGHKALAASIVKRAPYVGIERLEVPKLSGVVSDFISSVIELPKDKGPLYDVAEEFERDLIKGHVHVSSVEEDLIPEIKYSFQNSQIPLHRASSTVSEMAPLLLYLKYSIYKNSVLIIEEPEAHLHPENQRILAKYLVRLIRRGVFVTVTTHSQFLVEQLNSLIMLSKIDPETRISKYNYGKDDFLEAHEVSAYLFAEQKQPWRHKITPIGITVEEGISQKEFLKIHESLYEETFMLRNDLGGIT